ncbi:MAG: hypothetical protein DMF57_11135 [Acidobacteria bacterium]|nr:MAG: hypothetical protein DMF57_11135 [Acidobacteriota bacterium]
MKKLSIAILALVLIVGCKNKASTGSTSATGNDTTVAQANLTPEQLGALGAKIAKNPGEAQKLLSEQGLTEDSFKQAVRKVSEDPAASKRYAEAYKKAS